MPANLENSAVATGLEKSRAMGTWDKVERKTNKGEVSSKIPQKVTW